MPKVSSLMTPPFATNRKARSMEESIDSNVAPIPSGSAAASTSSGVANQTNAEGGKGASCSR